MSQQLGRAVGILKEGGVIAYPTDTVYGLGADAFNEAAVSRVYQIKQRPPDQPLPLLLSDKADLPKMTDEMPEIAWLLAERFLPGGLTLVVRKSPSVPHWVTAGGDTVAVRIPNHPVALALIRGLGKPLVGTSANLSGLPSPNSAREVRKQLGNKVDFVLDGELTGSGVESTVVDMTRGVPVIMREGIISREEIETLLNKSGLMVKSHTS